MVFGAGGSGGVGGGGDCGGGVVFDHIVGDIVHLHCTNSLKYKITKVCRWLLDHAWNNSDFNSSTCKEM